MNVSDRLSKIKFESEEGRRHCREGIPAETGRTHDYYVAYSEEYQIEQNLTARSEQSGHSRIRRN